MVYEKPKLIDLNQQSEKGHGQGGTNCTTGSHANGGCDLGMAAGRCWGGQGASFG